jgi:hypothetical protein
MPNSAQRLRSVAASGCPAAFVLAATSSFMSKVASPARKTTASWPFSLAATAKRSGSTARCGASVELSE